MVLKSEIRIFPTDLFFLSTALHWSNFLYKKWRKFTEEKFSHLDADLKNWTMFSQTSDFKSGQYLLVLPTF